MTKPRAFFEQDLLPAFAARFDPSDLVLNIGAGRHSYRERFPCRVVTADRDPGAGCEETFAAETIPHADSSIAGVLMMGVFERLDDPMQTMRELYRVVRPGGFLLLSALDLGTDALKASDRWRLTAGGAAWIAREFTTIAAHCVDGLVHFLVLQKPGAPRP